MSGAYSTKELKYSASVVQLLAYCINGPRHRFSVVVLLLFSLVNCINNRLKRNLVFLIKDLRLYL